VLRCVSVLLLAGGDAVSVLWIVCLKCASAVLRVCCGCVAVVLWLCCGCVAVVLRCAAVLLRSRSESSLYITCLSPPPLAVSPLLSLSFPLLKSCGSFSFKYVIGRDTSGVCAHARENVCARV